jgi:hypothetical protein
MHEWNATGPLRISAKYVPQHQCGKTDPTDLHHMSHQGTLGIMFLDLVPPTKVGQRMLVGS